MAHVKDPFSFCGGAIKITSPHPEKFLELNPPSKISHVESCIIKEHFFRYSPQFVVRTLRLFFETITFQFHNPCIACNMVRCFLWCESIVYKIVHSLDGGRWHPVLLSHVSDILSNVTPLVTIQKESFEDTIVVENISWCDYILTHSTIDKLYNK